MLVNYFSQQVIYKFEIIMFAVDQFYLNMLKDNNTIKRPNNIMEDITQHQKKVKSIKSMLESIYTTGNSCQYSEAELRQCILQKKTSNTNMEPILITEKTTKIKKNKKKKKKAKETPKQKIWKHELCECCCAKTRAEEPSEDDDDFEDEDDSASIVNLVTCIIHQLLQEFYDELDKNLVKWLKEMDSHPGPTFMKMMRKLGDIFLQFDFELKEQIQREFYEADDPLVPLYHKKLMETKQEAPHEFKRYMVARFPLLKDFIENFDLKILTQQNTEELMKMSFENSLVEIVLAHMLDIANKKRKKKNKRKKQQLKKLHKNKDKQTEPGESYEENLIQWLQNLRIDHDKREICYAQEDWLNLKKFQPENDSSSSSQEK